MSVSLKQPNYQVVSPDQKVVISTSKHKEVTAIIGMDKKPFCMTILLRNGTLITIDRRNNVTMNTPMLSEMF
jgi:hypothetical protein